MHQSACRFFDHIWRCNLTPVAELKIHARIVTRGANKQRTCIDVIDELLLSQRV